jgi:hypothetical protein
MATAADLRDLALALESTTTAPHFDRTAFKVARIYATLAADGLSANLKFTPEEQEQQCAKLPDAFTPVDNAWGRQGWTTVWLEEIRLRDLKTALLMAWKQAQPKPNPKKRSPRSAE